MYQDSLSDKDRYVHREDSTEDAQEHAVRLNTLCRVYEQADRVLTGDPVQVHVMPSGPAPAWSDGVSIYINSEEIESFDLDELVQINGLNYHELAHHLYSPRKGTSLMQWAMEQELQDPGYLNAVNILEDQRIETLLCARYPAIIPYLTKTIIRWLANTPEAVVSNYVSIRGRRYLSLELRTAFRDMFYKPNLIPVIAEIVDQYRLLAFPRDYAVAKELIERFKKEVLDYMDIPNQKPESTTDGGPSQCGHRDPVSKGRPEPGKAQERDAERAKGIGTPEPTYVPKEPSDEQTDPKIGSESQSDINNQETDTVSVPVTGSGAQPLTVEEALKDRDKRSETTTEGYGSGHVESIGGIPENIAAILNAIESSILDRKDVQQDVKIKQKVIIGGDGKHTDPIKRGKYDSWKIPDSVIISARRFARELERLKQECEPNWQREQSSGRINVQRVIRGCEIDNAFDRWEEGSDGTDIETVLLIDRSGSMGSDNNDMRASEAMWVIKRAMEQIDAPVTVYSFDEKAELVFDKTQKVNRTQLPFIYGNGGTNPESALVASERLLLASRKKTKILFLITDGDFNHGVNDDIIKRLNARGVLTVFVLIANEDQAERLARYAQQTNQNRWHECSIHGSVSNASELIPFAKEVVTGTIKKAIHR